jgi:hypothetical protein
VTASGPASVRPCCAHQLYADPALLPSPSHILPAQREIGGANHSLHKAWVTTSTRLGLITTRVITLVARPKILLLLSFSDDIVDAPADAPQNFLRPLPLCFGQRSDTSTPIATPPDTPSTDEATPERNIRPTLSTCHTVSFELDVLLQLVRLRLRCNLSDLTSSPASLPP